MLDLGIVVGNISDRKQLQCTSESISRVPFSRLVIGILE